MTLNQNELKVCYIYQDQYPWDVRVKKITNALAEEGIEVHIISRNRDCLPAHEKLSHNLYVHRLSGNVNKYILNIINFPAFFSPFWINKITNIVRKYSIDIIIVRDLPLSPAAYIAAKATNKPVVMDMAENYPALIKSTWTYRGPKPIDYIVRNPALLKWLERLIIPFLDGVLVVSRYSGKRIEKICKNQQKVWIVSNTPIIHDSNEHLQKIGITHRIRSNSSFILLYVGFIEAHRGLEIPIKTVSLLAEIMPDILLVIVGKGSFESRLKDLVIDLGIENNVIFTGWIPHNQVPSFINIADVCLIPHYVTEHTDTTFPNKIFDYMAQRKAVIVTQSRALSEIVENANCGLTYKDNSPESLCNAIRKLFDVRVRKTLGDNGWAAIQKELNWNHDKIRLLDAINELTI
jgi:glycosyltransferase involved in cell wall biosynthesis